MHKKESIPVNHLHHNVTHGIAVNRMDSETSTFGKEADQSHRHDYHLFMIIEKGCVQVELDFEKQVIDKTAIVYVYPGQVHRILSAKQASIMLVSLKEEMIDKTYLELIEEIMHHSKPIVPNEQDAKVLLDTSSLCLEIHKRKSEKMKALLLGSYCNALLGFIISQFQENNKLITNNSRPEIITNDFKKLLGQSFIQMKQPSEYATALNLSLPYLNECVRNITGFSVSYHIHNRIILEAKRLLFHSNKTVKEIAEALGYQDYAYFSRFFKNKTGMSALQFKSIYLD
ncbi:AraC family transcriptional regulator [Chondrinema litorale]|uniref:AraC family transcriptional regulator n=1 Tax=Chondrinema litorale TaxID=2994555 RepID=UPI002543F048|nr:AraC family transcriptional regulator [Chondrinema litorale]UZR96574.1 helix-turn-helix domain-containing protein [Chondrinema litorale]